MRDQQVGATPRRGQAFIRYENGRRDRMASERLAVRFVERGTDFGWAQV